jgi:hypothetical protein
MINVWNYQVRLVPLLMSLALFGVFHLLRKLTRVEYAPSYFAVFPLSKLDFQLSKYFGEYYGGEYIPAKDRKLNADLFVKSLISFFLTIFLIPLLVGVLVSFIITPPELLAFLSLLLLWQGMNCAKATYEFYSYRGDKSVFKYLVSFYGVYLLCLFLFIRYGYRLSYSFASKGDWKGLLSSIESAVVPLIIGTLILGVASALFAHLLINKDALKSEESFEKDKPENNTDP